MSHVKLGSNDECNLKKLGGMLLERLGDKTLSWLADESLVSCGAVSLWLSGKCRPTPQRLGHIAAILGFSEVELEELMRYAGYGEDDYALQDKVYRAYNKWHSEHMRKQKRDVSEKITQEFAKRIANLIHTDPEFKRICRKKAPECLLLAYQMEGG